MKFIHTADWHLGQTLYQYSRLEEFTHFFDHLKETIRKEQPDALLVSGDLFDNALPSVEAQEYYYTTVVALHHVWPQMHIIIIAGNHDSASRLEAPNKLWAALHVTVVGQLSKAGDVLDPHKHIVGITSDDRTLAYVAALPHCYVGNLPHAPGEDDSYQARVVEAFRALRRQVDDLNVGALPVLAMAHLSAVDVCAPCEAPMLIGGKETLEAAALGAMFDYVALGHIHDPRFVHNLPQVRYPGAPIPISFAETYPHGVIVGEIDDRHKLTLRRENYPTLIPVEKVPIHPSSAEEVLQALMAYPADRRAYVRANVLQSGAPMPDLKERARRCMEGKVALFCDIEYTYPECEKTESGIQIRTVSELKKIQPLEMAERYYMEQTHVPMTEEQIKMFNQVMEELNS